MALGYNFVNTLNDFFETLSLGFDIPYIETDEFAPNSNGFIKPVETPITKIDWVVYFHLFCLVTENISSKEEKGGLKIHGF